MIDLSKDNYIKFIESNDCVIQFSAPWCGPCKILYSTLSSISLNEKNIKIAKVDISKIPDSSSHFNIKSVPTIISFKNGKETSRVIGNRSKEHLVSFVNKSFMQME